MALVELQADRAGDALVDLLHVGVEIFAQRLPPQPGVREIGPLAIELGLELVLVDRAHEPLELLVGGQDDRRRGHLVDVSDLQPDDAVLDVVDDADAVARAELGDPFQQLHELEALAVQRDRHAALEAHLHHLGLIGRILGARHQLEDVVLRRLLEILDPATLRGAPPEVVVDRVGRASRCRP